MGHLPQGASQGTPLLDRMVHNPISVAITKAGGVLIADAQQVVHLAPLARFAECVVPNLRFPQAVAVSADDHVAIVDTDKCRILYLINRSSLQNFLRELAAQNGTSLLSKLGPNLLDKVLSLL